MREYSIQLADILVRNFLMSYSVEDYLMCGVDYLELLATNL